MKSFSYLCGTVDRRLTVAQLRLRQFQLLDLCLPLQTEAEVHVSGHLKTGHLGPPRTRPFGLRPPGPHCVGAMGAGNGVRTRFVRADRGQAVDMVRPRRADEAGGPGSASQRLAMAFVQPLAGPARTLSASPLPVANGPPTRLGRAGQQVADRRETARSAHQGHPRHTVGQRDLGSAHHAATQPPVNPATTRKTAKRVLTPFPSSANSLTRGSPRTKHRMLVSGSRCPLAGCLRA